MLAYVAVALWPWLMFSEGLNRATMAVQEHSALLGKVAVPAGLLVVANLSATFILHTVGYVFVNVSLWLLGYPLTLIGLMWLPVGLALLFALTLGLALLTSAIQVLVRDLAQVLAQLMGFWFFLTPILYGRSQLPLGLQPVFDLNPLTFHAEAARATLLHASCPEWTAIAQAAVLSGVVLLIGSWVFRRLRRHFEDFL